MIRAESALSLLVLRIFADDHYAAFSLDNLALFADLFHGRLNFHFCNTFPFLLFSAPGYASFVEVVNRNLNGDFVTRQDSYVVHSELSRNVCGDYMTVREFNLEDRVGHRLNNGTFKFNNVVLRQNNPSFENNSNHAFVNTRTPSGSTATVFS